MTSFVSKKFPAIRQDLHYGKVFKVVPSYCINLIPYRQIGIKNVSRIKFNEI